MGKIPLRRLLDAVGVLCCETALLAFFWCSGGLLGTVPFRHFAAWARAAGGEEVLTALFRVLGLGISTWLALGTVVYAVAVLTGRRRWLRALRAVTLPAVRRVMDGLVAATMAASTLGTAAGIAGATGPPKPVPVVAAVAPLTPAPSAGALDGPRPPTTAAAYGFSTATPATGRHLPHPGRGRDLPPPKPPAVAATGRAPSLANGFAGLAAGTKVIVVQPGDCLSVLAERHLGDWRLDSEIARLNYGRRQPDGLSLVNENWIYPGWVLVMPADAAGALVVGAPDGGATGQPTEHRPTEHRPAEHRPTEHRERHADVGDRSPRQSAHGQDDGHVPPERPTTEKGRGTETDRNGAPKGVRLPAHRRALGEPAEHRPEQLSGAHGHGYAGDDRGRVPPGQAKHADDLPRRAQAGRPTAPRRPAGAPSRHRDEHGVATGEAAVAVAVIGGLVAGGVVWRLGRTRREQGHARPRGRAFARNRPDVEAAERRARAVAGEDAVQWVDLGVRYLSGLVEQMSSDGHRCVPTLVLARAAEARLEVVVSPMPQGRLGWFSPSCDGNALVLDQDIDLEDLAALAEGRWAAWPALVSVGEVGGSNLLVNLEAARALSIEGPDHVVEAVLASFVLQLACQPWSDEMLSAVHVVVPPANGELPPGAHRVGKEAALELAEQLDGIAHARRELAGELPLSTLRALACEALPSVAVAFRGTPENALRCLAEAAVADSSGVALAGAGPFPDARWRLVLGPAGDATLYGWAGDDPFTYQLKTSCQAREVALLSEALGATTDHCGVPGVEVDGEFAPDRADHRALTDVVPSSVADAAGLVVGNVEVRVLGPVDVVGGDPEALERTRRAAPLALLAYLATHPRPVSADELARHLWPLDTSRDDFGGPQRKTVMNVISRARAMLGYGAGSRERIAHSPMGYRLAGDVSLDWSRFQALVQRAKHECDQTAAATLRAALELVRGEPFAGNLSSQFFEWVASEHLDLIIAAKIVDVANDLAERALAAGDLDGVNWAVEKGLLLEPTREELYRVWMHAQGRAGRPAMVDEIYRRLKVLLRQRVHALQEPQEETYQVWKTYVVAEAARAR
ncbi:MAG TPA: BTAD domain-containing putative transcriptional regulator [Acidimicrobiales bacterium]|nr:BTAD domain-containing putative transcriptional regulator [Acidimicrobiales bacterium]